MPDLLRSIRSVVIVVVVVNAQDSTNVGSRMDQCTQPYP